MALELVDEAYTIDLTVTYLDELEALAEAVGRALREIFEDLTAEDKESLARFIAEAEPFVKAGQATGADLAAAYLSEITGVPPALIDLRFPEVALEGPYHRMWHQMGEGYDYADARASGASVAEGTGYSATSDGASTQMGHPGTKVRGYRRVINIGACEWCQVISTQLYRSQESATFGHRHCRCGVVAVPFGDHSAAKVNQARLAALRKSGAITRVSAARERSRARGGF